MVGFLSLAKEVHCISSFTYRVMRQYLPKRIKIIHQLLSGVDYFFFSQKRNVSELKAIYNGWPIILTVGALKERKGIDLSLRAFKLVKLVYKDALYIIGTDKFYLSLLGSVSGRDACHRCCTGFVLQSLSIT
jgi:glycosyltransferase involved in cell wall biosynthesis